MIENSKTKLNLAFSLFKYFPFGGLQRDFVRIAAECIQRGHNVHVYTTGWQGSNELSLPITYLRTSAWQNHTRGRQFATACNQQVKAQNYDVHVGFNKMPGLDFYYAADTCYQAKTHTRSIWYRITPRYRHLKQYEAAVFAPSESTHILLLSEPQQDEYQHYYKTPSERFHLLPPGISKDRIAPSNATEIRNTLRQQWQVKENEFLLLMVGSGFKTKGLDRIIRGLASLPASVKSHLFIVGEDHSQPFISQAKQLGILDKIKFLGGRNDIPQLMLAADLLVHPAYNENTGTVLLEALAAGLPVLTTDVCGYAKYITQAEAGVVLPSPFQQQQFNHYLHDMLITTQRRDWCSNGIQFAKKEDIYSLPQHAVNIIEKIYAERQGKNTCNS